MTPNLPELKRLNMWVQEQDKLEPGARIWYQDDWAYLREETPMCQTAYCVAGMTVTRAGHYLIADRNEDLWLDGEKAYGFDVEELAQNILGIDESVADMLFDGGNSAEQVDQVIRGIFERAGADYDSVEAAPDREIEIKAAEAVRPQLLPTEMEAVR
jgi:hypothetical protein